MSGTGLRVAGRVLDLGLRQPFFSRRGTATTVQMLLVELSDQGRTGRGTAFAPAGADPAAFLEGALAELTEALAGHQPSGPSGSSEPAERRTIVEKAAAAQPAAVRLALNVALHDLDAQLAGRTLRTAIGAPVGSLPPSALTLTAASEDELVEQARAAAAWPILKVKVSADIPVDLVRRLREIHRGEIWVDGNGGWTAADAVRAAQVCTEAGVTLIEQPVAPDDLDGLAHVHRHSATPVFIDEGCTSVDDVIRSADRVSGVNVKIHRCGGITPAIEIIRAARARGLAVMIGCKSESTVGVTAAAQLAGWADHLDLDGHLDIVGDPFSGIALDGGRVRLPTGPGLGLTPLSPIKGDER